MSGRPYLVFAIVAPALLIASIDNTIVVVGLSTLIRELDTTLPTATWTFTGVQLTQTIVMPMAGKLSNDLGRKRVFLAAIFIFMVGSIGSGLSPDIYTLIFFRVLQGVGGGAIMPSATGLVSDAFGDRRQTALGLFTSIFPFGGVIGPNVGGFIIDNLSWRWMFFFNVPMAVLLLIVGTIFIKRDVPSGERKKFDSLGAGLFGAGIFGILYCLTFIANHPSDLTNPQPWLLLTAGVTCLVLFLRHEVRTEEPMIEITLLKWRPMAAANLYNFLFGASVFGFFSFMPYYATQAYGMTAGQSGIILTPRSIAMILTSTVTSIYLIRFGYRLPMIGGILLIAASLFLVSQGFHDVTLLGFEVPDLVLLSMMVMIGGFGMGLGGPASQNAALDLIPEQLSVVAGLRGMFRSTGGVLGTATMTLIISQFDNKVEGLEYIYLGLGVLMLTIIPVVLLIPDTAREKMTNTRGRVRTEDVLVDTSA